MAPPIKNTLNLRAQIYTGALENTSAMHGAGRPTCLAPFHFLFVQRVLAPPRYCRRRSRR